MADLSLDCPSCGAHNIVPMDASTDTFTCAGCGETSAIDAAATVHGEVQDDYLVGEIVSDCKVVEKVGEGGFGSVYKAIDQNLQRPVALKVMLRSLTSNVEFVQKFIREAVTAAQLNHPNIVAIHKVGRDEARGLHYLIMEFVPGITLSDLVSKKGVLTVEESIPIMTQACDALATAHEHNIVHRDIKPENLMLDEGDRLKITDFGLAKSLSTDHKTTKVMGTPHYMSPEQFEGKPVDGRSDIYSLGVTFFYLLSKARPYEGQNTVQIIYSILTQEPKALPDINKDVPQKLWKLIEKMIAKKAEDRYQTLRETIEDLNAFQRTLGGDRSACPDCGAKNPKGRKFCRGCGAALLVRCPACGNDEHARSPKCSSCGADVARLLKVKKLLEAGKRFQSLGDLRRAADSYRGALDLDPHNAEAQTELDQLGGALKEVERVKSEADVLMKTGDIESALARVEELLERHPVAVEVREHRDQLKQQLAARQVNSLLEEAELAAGEGDVRRALAVLDKALRLDPDRADVRARRADLGRRVAAVTESRQKAVEALAAGRFEDAYALAAEVLKATPDDTAMEEVRNKAQASVESVDSLVSQGREMLAARDWSDALSRFESALALRPGDGQLLGLVDDTRRKIQEHRERMATCRRQLAEREFTAAAEGLRAILAESPDDAEAQSLLDACDKASQEAQRTIAVAEALDEAGRFDSHGDLESALDALTQVVELDPRNDEALTRKRDVEKRLRHQRDIRALADEHLADGRYEDAVAALERLKHVNEARVDEIDAEIAEARNREQAVAGQIADAERLIKARDYRAAAAAADAVLRVAPRHPRAVAIRKDSDKAIAAVNRFLSEADRLILSEMFDEAMESLDKARERGAAPDEYGPRVQSCEQGRMALLKTDATRSLVANDYDAAIAAYEQVLEVAGTDADALKGKKSAERRIRIKTTEPLMLRLGTAAIVLLLLGLVRMTAVASTETFEAKLDRNKIEQKGPVVEETLTANFAVADDDEAAGDWGAAIAAYDAELARLEDDPALEAERAQLRKLKEFDERVLAAQQMLDSDPAGMLDALDDAATLVDFRGAQPKRQNARRKALAALAQEAVTAWYATADALWASDTERSVAMLERIENHPASAGTLELDAITRRLGKLEQRRLGDIFRDQKQFRNAAAAYKAFEELAEGDPGSQQLARASLTKLRDGWMTDLKERRANAGADEAAFFEVAQGLAALVDALLPEGADRKQFREQVWAEFEGR